MKRLSTAKQELSKKNMKIPVKENPPSVRARGRRMNMQEEEDDDEEEKSEDKEEPQSLTKRKKNIQENKAMVINSQLLANDINNYCKCFKCISSLTFILLTWWFFSWLSCLLT